MTGAAHLRIAGPYERPAMVTITVDGAPMQAAPGESVAAALLAGGIVRLGTSFRAGTPRGAFCFMGVCQECLVRIDGKRVQACTTSVREGQAIVLSRL